MKIIQKLRIPVASRLSIQEKKKLDALTRKFNTTKSEVIRELVNEFIQEHENGENLELLTTKNIQA